VDSLTATPLDGGLYMFSLSGQGLYSSRSFLVPGTQINSLPLDVFDIAFRDVYRFKLWQVSVTFLGLLIRMLLAIAFDPIWSWNYIRLMRRKEKETGPGRNLRT
jgi:hypothetical protein